MHLVCTITEDFQLKAAKFLSSLQKISRVDCNCVCYGFNPSGGLKDTFPYINFFTMPKHPSESYGMIQHGRFLDALPHFGNDDVLNLSDVDVIVQRNYSNSEYQLFNSFGQNMIAVGQNESRHDTMAKEAERIGYDEEVNLPIWNCGNIVASVGLFRRIQKQYESNCQEFYKKCTHRSRCQYHFWKSYYHLDPQPHIIVMTQRFHSHGHFGTPEGVTVRDGKAYHHDDLIMFAHRLEGVANV